MSPLFNLHKTAKQVYNDDELQQLTENDGYRRGKQIRDVLTYVFCVLIVLLAIALVWEYITDPTFKVFILAQVKDSFKGIIFFVLAMLGIKYNSSSLQ